MTTSKLRTINDLLLNIDNFKSKYPMHQVFLEDMTKYMKTFCHRYIEKKAGLLMKMFCFENIYLEIQMNFKTKERHSKNS